MGVDEIRRLIGGRDGAAGGHGATLPLSQSDAPVVSISRYSACKVDGGVMMPSSLPGVRRYAVMTFVPDAPDGPVYTHQKSPSGFVRGMAELAVLEPPHALQRHCSMPVATTATRRKRAGYRLRS